MRKLRLIYLLLLLPFWANAQWIAGGTTQTILSGNKQIRWNFGTNGFVYGYTKGQIDSLFSVGSGVSSVFGRTGAVTAQAGDYAAFYAPISGGGYIPYTGATSTFNRNQQDIIGSFTGGGNTYSDLLSAGSWSQNVHDLTSTYSISSAYQPQNTMHSNIPNGVLANQVFTRYGLDNTKTYGLIDGNVALKFSTPFVGLVTGRTTYGALEYLPKQRIDSLLAPKITLTSLSANSPLIYNNANGTFSIQLAGSSQPGYLSSTDWNIFNNKEPTIAAGTTLQYWRGDKTFQTLNTAVVPELTNLYYTNARGIGSILTGYTSGTGTISSSDNILQAIQKLNGNISTGYIPNNNATATPSSGYAFNISGNGQVNGTFKVGSYVSTASTGISVSQLVTSANNHGIEIARVINPSSASGGVAEFDARTQSLGSFDIDHFVSYQARGKWSSSANTNNMNGLWVLDEMDGSGIVYSRNGVRVQDINKTGVGDLQNNIGLYVAPQLNGSLTNYNILSSLGRNAFTGKVNIGNASQSTTEALYVVGTTYLDGAVTTATAYKSTAFAGSKILTTSGTSIVEGTTGTGVLTALGVNIGSAGAPVLFNGAGGTPASMIGTNITGTAAGLSVGGSAATLTTTRTIWGQNFNGSANVSGAITGATSITANGIVTGVNLFATTTGGNPEVRITPVTTGTSIISLLNVAGSSPIIGYQGVLRMGTVTGGAGAGTVNTMTLDASNNVNVTNALTVGSNATVTGNTTSTSFIKSGGTNTQFLMADGSVNSTVYATQLRITGSGTGAATTISIAHGLSGVTSASIALVQPINAASAGVSYITTDATNINIVYTVAPAAGTNNLSYNISIKP